MTVGTGEESAPPLLPPRRDLKTSSFIEEEKQPMPPPTPIPPRVTVEPTSSSSSSRKIPKGLAADLVPDLHGAFPAKGLPSELNTHDTGATRQAITEAEKKAVPPTVNMPGVFSHGPANLIPNWYRTGWTSLSSQDNPGGNLDIQATRASVKKYDFLDDTLPSFLYGEWYHNGAALFITAIVSWTLAKMNAGLGAILLFCLFIGKVHNNNVE